MNTLFETNKLIEQYTKILFKKWNRIKCLNKCFVLSSENVSNNNTKEIIKTINSLTEHGFQNQKNRNQIFYVDILKYIPSLLKLDQQEKLISKLNEYSQFIIQHTDILSFNSHLYHILNNINIYKDHPNVNDNVNINIYKENSNKNKNENNISLKDYYIHFYQYYYSIYKDSNNLPIFINNPQNFIHNLKNHNINQNNIINNNNNNNNYNNNNNNNNTHEEISWAEITSRSEVSLNNKSPQLSEVYKHPLHSFSSLESFSSRSEHINDIGDSNDSIHMNDDSINNNIVNNTNNNNNNDNKKKKKRSSFYSRKEFIPSVDSFFSNSKINKINKKLKSFDTNSSSSTTNTTTTNNNNNISGRLLPIDIHYTSDYLNKGYLTLSPVQTILPNNESLTTVSNINSEIYHDNNSYSEQINRSKLDLQKIINDKSPLPYQHYNNSANNVSTTNANTNNNITLNDNNNNNTNINNKRSSSHIDRTNSKLNNNNNNNDINDDETSSSLPDNQQKHHHYRFHHHHNNNNNNKKSHHTKSILKNLISHTDIPKSQSYQPEFNINDHFKSSTTTLKPVITPGPSILDKNGSLIRSELESSSSFSSYNSSTSFSGTHSMNNSNDPNTTANTNTNANTNSSSIIDVFLVTKPKKVGLNILNQHIEYAVTARKFGEKDIVSYKRYSDFVKLRDYLYLLCQDRSKSNKKKKKKLRNSSNSFKRSSFNLKKRDMSFDERYIGYPALDNSNKSMSKKKKRRSTTSIEINKLIKAFGGTGIHDDIDNNNGYTGEDVSLDHPSLNSSSDDEDEMAIVNKILPPFPQKKIVGKFNSNFIEKRRESLQTFLNDILMEPSLEFLIPTIQQWVKGELDFQ
ncbi:hypothetical protein BCR32DRAFT_266115 [Anaeromyces robustus]|uniref:PX domain-containing protein n=1 Tax=Anaeromyces robustus TaxID=1754192 RepID=A0A1Y1XGA4_9FUNG|nr:hypothetical protein BCR32DRAFT_266115 [Anaeromyces robustus]|eukprot:ORX84757.1 hypothetical protein BCR32DRAFT_266115 [Anaeromyces robustus]